MDLSLAERASCVARYLAKKRGITQAEVGQLMGYSNRSAFSAVLTGQKRLPQKFGEKLAALDPAVNPAFLDGTSEDMLLSADEQPAVKENINKYVPEVKPGSIVVPPELAQMFTDMAATIRSQQEMIRDMRAEKGRATNAG